MAGAPVEAEERGRVLASFAELVERNKKCGCCFDAEAEVKLSRLGQSGTLSGYLQAMAPGLVKFVAVNPLGQPLLVFASDGTWFRTMVVGEHRFYSGDVNGAGYRKYAPAGFRAGESFAWLSGRLEGEAYRVEEVRRSLEPAEPGYWLRLRRSDGPDGSLVLFEPASGVLRRHLLLDERQEPLLDVRYGAYQGTGACPWPAEITVTSSRHNGTASLRLSNFLAEPALGGRDFELQAPAGFETVVME